MTLRVLSLFLVLAVASPALAQDLTVSVGDPTGATVPITVENGYDFPVTVVNVRLTLENDLGEDVHFFSEGTMQHALDPGGEWSGPLTFVGADGSAPGEGIDFSNYDRASVGAGVDIDAFAPAAETAVASGTFEERVEALQTVRGRTPPISRTSRFHAEQIAASDLSAERYFSLERVDGLRESLETALCNWASEQVINLRGSQESKQDQYNALSEQMRGAGLHINCMNSEGRLAAARMLLAGSRPQDALLFKETDEDGNLLPEWEPIFITANLALARTAAELGVQQFTSVRPALEALNNVQDIAPDNADMLAIAQTLVPNAARWVTRASGPIERDLDTAQQALEMLRPRWSQFEQVEAAAATFADALIEAGLEYCNRREYVNSRNRFIRGERILEGIPAWEERADEINRCRALGALEEGREIARTSPDDDAPAQGYEKLEEAQQRFELTDAEVAAFQSDIASAWVAVANRQLQVEGDAPQFAGAAHSLEEAEEVSPTGATDEIRTAWILYAEQMYGWKGLGMSGADVEEARAAVARAEDIDPERIAAIESKLTLAFYGYRVGIPAIASLLALLAGLIAFMNKRKAKKFADMDVDDI